MLSAYKLYSEATTRKEKKIYLKQLQKELEEVVDKEVQENLALITTELRTAGQSQQEIDKFIQNFRRQAEEKLRENFRSNLKMKAQQSFGFR